MPTAKLTEADRERVVEEKQVIKSPPKRRKTKMSAKSPIQGDTPSKTYLCFSCGKEYTKLAGNFPVSPHPMFKGNNGYAHICRPCVSHYLAEYEEMFGNDGDMAVRHLGMYLGMYVSDAAVDMSRRVNKSNDRIFTLASKQNMTQFSGKCYDNYVVESRSDSIESLDELEELKAGGEINITQATIERWGIGAFSADDYKLLDEHYKILRKTNPNVDANQEIFIKDLCYIKLQQMASMKHSKPDDFDKLTKLYRDTFKQAGLKTVAEADSSGDETLGVTLAVISQYTPEEYYKDKKLYKDWDGFGDYIKRHVWRPLKNLITGSTERDEEYSIKDDEE